MVETEEFEGGVLIVLICGIFLGLFLVYGP